MTDQQNDSELWGYAFFNNLTADWSYHKPAFTHDEVVEIREQYTSILFNALRYNLDIQDYGNMVLAYLENDKFRDKRLTCHTLFTFTQPMWDRFVKSSKNLIVIETARRLEKEKQDA